MVIATSWYRRKGIPRGVRADTQIAVSANTKGGFVSLVTHASATSNTNVAGAERTNTAATAKRITAAASSSPNATLPYQSSGLTSRAMVASGAQSGAPAAAARSTPTENGDQRRRVARQTRTRSVASRGTPSAAGATEPGSRTATVGTDARAR